MTNFQRTHVQHPQIKFTLSTSCHQEIGMPRWRYMKSNVWLLLRTVEGHVDLVLEQQRLQGLLQVERDGHDTGWKRAASGGGVDGTVTVEDNPWGLGAVHGLEVSLHEPADGGRDEKRVPACACFYGPHALHIIGLVW